MILDHIAHLDLIQSSVDTANETRNVVLSMLESINATDIKTGIYQITTNSLDILNQTTSNCKYAFSLLPLYTSISVCIVYQSVM